MKSKAQPVVFIPSCPSQYLTAFPKAWCVCVLAVCLMLGSEIRLVNVFINKHLWCLPSLVVSSLLTFPTVTSSPLQAPPKGWEDC